MSLLMGNYVVSWYSAPVFVTAFCSLVVGLWVLGRNRSSRLGAVIFGGSAAIGFWLACFGMVYLSADAPTALLWARLAHIAVPLLPVAIYLYITVGLRSYQSDRFFVWASVFLALVFIVLALATRLVIADMHQYSWGFYPRYGPAGGALAGFFAVVIIIALMNLWARLGYTARGSVFSRRLVLSCTAGVVAGVASVDFLLAFGVPVYPFGWAAVLGFLGILFVMERRHSVVYMTPGVAAEQILATMQGAILVTSPQGIVEVCNRSAARLLGRSEGDMIGLSLNDVFVSETEWHMVLEDCLAGGKIEDLEVWWANRDGGTVEVSVSASCVTGDRGEPAGIVFAAMDLTRRREGERELREAEAQLRESQKMEAIGQLAGGIAHDFNNLLTAIIGNSALGLAGMADDDPNRPLLKDIHEVAQRAADLTKQILAFSRRQVLKPELLCLNDIVSKMEPLLRRSLGEDIELTLSLAPGLWESEIDSHQMGQVILNLALNAREAMPDGGRLLVETRNLSISTDHARRHPEAKAGDHVVLAISDTGSGMDKETQAHVFEPFFTTRGLEKAVGRGTGLGLSTAFGIVKQSGGRISVYSEPGQGTTFKVYLPAARCSPSAALRHATAHARAAGAGVKVLVVEDEAPVRRLVTRVLSDSGFEVMGAGSARETEDLVDVLGFAPDLLVTDVVLPGGTNGRQLADYLIDRLPGLNVVYMSGYTRAAAICDGRINDGVAFLEKPFDPDTLLRAVHETLLTGSHRTS